MFTPRELADLTIDFYRRNYIEGLFLSSAVVRSPDYTTELMIRTLTLLREDYGFSGYIHAKAIPGADPLLTARLGRLADRLSVNIELPSSKSLALLAPDKKTRHFSADGSDQTGNFTVQGRAPEVSPRPGLRPGGAVHPDDRGGLG